MNDAGYVSPEECAAYKAGRDAAPPDAAALAAAALALTFVGRCATCRWAETWNDTLFRCLKLDESDTLASLDGEGVLLVAPSFGCVTWEAKDAAPVALTGVPAAREWVGFQAFECPACRAAGRVSDSQGIVTVSTDDAARGEQIPNGLRWVGVPCHVCGATYTVEATQGPETDPETPEVADG